MATRGIFPEIDESRKTVVQIRTRFREGRSDRVPLNDQERRDLYNLIQSPGWLTVLKLMEDECIQQETNLVNVDAADEKRVLAEHSISKTMWLFFTRFQKKVSFEVNELLGNMQGPELSAEDADTMAILDATRE